MSARRVLVVGASRGLGLGIVAVLESRLGQRGCVFLDHAGETVPW